MSIGRVPRYIYEAALAKDLFKRAIDGEKILKPGRLITIWAPQTTPPPGMVNTWMPHEFQYPSVVFPVTPAEGLMLAHIAEKPDEPPTVGTYAKQSHGGMLYIPFPGIWWIAYDGPTDSRLACVVYDDTCGDAQQMLEKFGIAMEDSYVNVTAAAAVTLIAPNAYRDGVIVQNQGLNDIYVRRGASGGLTPANVGNGIKVTPDRPLELVGKLAFKGALNARADGGDSSVLVVEVVS